MFKAVYKRIYLTCQILRRPTAYSQFQLSIDSLTAQQIFSGVTNFVTRIKSGEYARHLHLTDGYTISELMQSGNFERDPAILTMMVHYLISDYVIYQATRHDVAQIALYDDDVTRKIIRSILKRNVDIDALTLAHRHYGIKGDPIDDMSMIGVLSA